MQEYRFVEIPDLDALWKSLRSKSSDERAHIKVRDARNQNGPVEEFDLVVKSLHNDKGDDGMWMFDGLLIGDELQGRRVRGMFISPPDKDMLISLFHTY
jgi:hypothetical protein